MTDAIIMSRNGLPSMRRVEEYMHSEVNLFRCIDHRWRKWCGVPKDLNKVIRWGTTAEVPSKTEYNSASSVALASNKYKARLVMREAGVPVPKLTETEFPVIGRPEHHQAGENFYVCTNEDEVRASKSKGAAYFSGVYPKTKEYRVHIGSGCVLFVSEKIVPETYKGIIWNHAIAQAFFRRVRWNDWPLEVIKISVKAAKALQVDFGAVDVMAFPSLPDFPLAVVCEINTAPAVDTEYNSQLYAEYFDFLLTQDEKYSFQEFNFETAANFAFRRRINDSQE